jgi:hypothetical protein
MTQLTKATKETTTKLVANEHFKPAGDFNPEDIILPTIGLRQNTFKKDEYKKLSPGDVILRPDMKVIASETKAFRFVPVSVEKVCRVFEVFKSDTKFVRFEEPSRDKPQDFTENGRTLRRDTTYIVYMLPLDAAERMAASHGAGEFDIDNMVLPTRISLSRGSFYAGKVIASHFELCSAFNASPVTKVFSLKSAAKSNDRGNWFVYDIAAATDQIGKETVAAKTPKEVLPICQFWAETMKKSKHNMKVATEDDDLEVETVVPVDESMQTF